MESAPAEGFDYLFKVGKRAGPLQPTPPLLVSLLSRCGYILCRRFDGCAVVLNSPALDERQADCVMLTRFCGTQILLVGDSGVGKSSLLLRFTEDQFDESSIPTIGTRMC